MNEPWYESQLVGVVVGVLSGFLLSLLPNLIDERRKQKSLIKALNAEINCIIDYWEPRIPVYENYISTLKKNGSCSLYYALERDPDVIFTTNAANLSLIPQHSLDDLVDFYYQVGYLHSRLKAVQDVFVKYNSKEDPTLETHFLIETMESTVILIRGIISIGKNILKEMK